MQTQENHNEVTLIFPNINILWAFAQTLTCKSIEIRSAEKSITCPCTEVEISIALSNYHGKLYESRYPATVKRSSAKILNRK